MIDQEKRDKHLLNFICETVLEPPATYAPLETIEVGAIITEAVKPHLHAVTILCALQLMQDSQDPESAPAMESGLTDTGHDMKWIVGLIDAMESAPKKLGPKRKEIQTETLCATHQ